MYEKVIYEELSILWLTETLWTDIFLGKNSIPVAEGDDLSKIKETWIGG